MTTLQFAQNEVNRAIKQLSPMLSRKLGTKVGVVEDVERFNSDLKSGLLVEKVEWLLTGSYGSEYRDLLISDYVTSPRKKQALKRICINAFMYTSLIDYEDLNSHKITQLVKQSGIIESVNLSLVEFMTDGYGAEHWGLIESL